MFSDHMTHHLRSRQLIRVDRVFKFVFTEYFIGHTKYLLRVVLEYSYHNFVLISNVLLDEFT